MSPARVKEIFRLLQLANPEPKPELNYSTPYELLVAVVLSAQSTDVGVNKATAKLFPVANTAEAMRELGEEGLKPYISSIGLYNNKARHIVMASNILLQKHAGEVPADRESLQALPGVGRKTANVILNIAFGQPTIAVDTHIFRVSNRTGLAPGKTPLAVEQKLLQVVPEDMKHHAHHWLILHGRYICRARKPKCPVCPIWKECQWPQKDNLSI
ncbi:MAG: endonuclease III [Mariprofundaceae bacterium]